MTFLAVILAPTLRAYIHQRSEISALEQQIAQQKSTVKTLSQEKQDWQDPHYVEQQARERLKFVMPGDKQYTTITGDKPADATSPESGIASVPDDVRAHRPWYGEMWESVVIADSGAKAPASESTVGKKAEPPAVRDTKSGK